MPIKEENNIKEISQKSSFLTLQHTDIPSVAKYEMGPWLAKIGPFPDHFFMSIRTKSGLF